MKKNNSFYLTLLMIPVCAVLFLSYSAGQNSFYVSGSPFDIANDEDGIGNCTKCHNNFTPEMNSTQVTLDVPIDYELNTTYAINVTSSHASTKQGFQMSAEDDAGNKVGDFEPIDGNSQDFTVDDPDVMSPINGEAITHTFQGNSFNSWTFNWTSPPTDVGPITFYTAVNATNGDFNAEVGDLVLLKQSESHLLSVEKNTLSKLKLYPNPSQDFFNIELPSNPEKHTKIQVYNILGSQIYSQELNTVQTIINVSKWQSGIYLLQFSNNNSTTTKRFIKQ